MPEAFIIDAVRTPVGRRGGEGWARRAPGRSRRARHREPCWPARTPIRWRVDDVVFGCVDTVGPQAGDIARTAWLAAGLPEAVPGVTVDRQCGSSQQAVHFAAQAVLSGTADLVVAGGVQNMSMVPIAAAMSPPYTDPFSGSAGWRARYGAEEISQFRAADLIADKWGISRAEMERYALASHQRAVRAIGEGAFAAEIAPYGGVTQDEGPRRTPPWRRWRRSGRCARAGLITAALSSQIADGAAALLIASDRAVRRARAAPAGPDRPPVRARRRPGADAHRADRGDRLCPARGPGWTWTRST